MNSIILLQDHKENQVKNQVENKLKLLKQLDLERKTADRLYNEIKQEIINSIGEQEEIKNSQGHIILTYKYETKYLFDSKKFESDFPDIYKEYKKEQISRKFLPK